MIFHTFRAKWMAVIRRPIEAMGTRCRSSPCSSSRWRSGSYTSIRLGQPAETLTREEHNLMETQEAVPQPVLLPGAYRSLLRGIFTLSPSGSSASRPGRTRRVAPTDRQQRVFGRRVALGVAGGRLRGFDWLMSLTPSLVFDQVRHLLLAGSFVSVFAILAIVAPGARGANNSAPTSASSTRTTSAS